MIRLSVRLRTRSGQVYEGTLVSGQFVLDGDDIAALRVSSLDLPKDVQAGSPLPGRLDLADGTTLSIRATRGWFARDTKYDVAGAVTLHVDSLGKDVTVEVDNIELMDVQLPENDSHTRSLITARFLAALELWLDSKLLERFHDDEVRFSVGTWHLEAELRYGGDPSAVPATKLTLRRALMSFSEDLATGLGLRLVKAVISDDGPRVSIELRR
ncbi:MAG: hypothetical protein V1790_01820 [Planctomycetota bacterium]